MTDAITLARYGSTRTWGAAGLSLLLGLVGVVAGAAAGRTVALVLGILLLVLGAVLTLASAAPRERLVVDDDAVSRSAGRQQLWRLRWAHMAAVRFVPDGVWLVPLPEVAGHPEIAPALHPREVDGSDTPTFEVPIDARVAPAVRAAVTRHAPPQLLAQSSPRPPST